MKYDKIMRKMIKQRLVSVLFLLFFINLCYSLEIQVALDKSGKLLTLDEKKEEKLKVFPEYKNFKEARLFQEDSLFVLEISRETHGIIQRERLSLSSDEVEKLRTRISNAITKKARYINLNQEGRTKYLLGTTALSLGYYGWSFPIMFNTYRQEGSYSLYFLISSAGFFMPYLQTKNSSVTDAAATLGLYGGTRGIIHGITISYLNREPSFETTNALGTIFSITEMSIFFKTANNDKMTAGSAEIIGAYGDFGLLWGLGCAHILSYFESEPRYISSCILAGSILGLIKGNSVRKQKSYSRGDAYIMRASWLIFAYVPWAITQSLEVEKEISTGISVLGSMVGLAIGKEKTLAGNFTTGQGVIVNLCEITGGFLGLGVAHLFNAKEDYIYYLLSASGATLGYFSIINSYEKQLTENSSISFTINPIGFCEYLQEKETSKTLLNLSLRF